MPVNSSSARVFYGMAFVAARGKTVLYGGGDSTGNLNDVWEWDGTDWANPMPVSAPVRHWGMVLSSIKGTQRVVLFGGGIDAAIDNETAE